MDSINMNDTVWIEPNSRTAAAHREFWVKAIGQQRYKPMTVRDGFVKMQLWEVMQVFGPSISLGCDAPFSTQIRFSEPESTSQNVVVDEDHPRWIKGLRGG